MQEQTKPAGGARDSVQCAEARQLGTDVCAGVRDDDPRAVRLNLGTVNGQGVRKTLYGQTRKEAQAKLDQAREDARCQREIVA